MPASTRSRSSGWRRSPQPSIVGPISARWVPKISSVFSLRHTRPVRMFQSQIVSLIEREMISKRSRFSRAARSEITRSVTSSAWTRAAGRPAHTRSVAVISTTISVPSLRRWVHRPAGRASSRGESA